MSISDCCGSEIVMGDICLECREHCDKQVCDECGEDIEDCGCGEEITFEKKDIAVDDTRDR